MSTRRYTDLAACLLTLLAACGGTITDVGDGGPGSDSGTGTPDAGRDSPTGTGSDAPSSDAPHSGGCPASPPAAGGSCPDTGLQCEYGTNPNLTCNELFDCTTSGWRNVSPPVTCTPQSECPAKYLGPMSQSNPCPASELDLTCAYPQGTCICSYGELATNGGPFWNCTPTTPTCPSPRPLIGTACSDPGAQCDYGSCEGGITIQCEDGIWQEDNMVACPASGGITP
jgi:hypothetical protein